MKTTDATPPPVPASAAIPLGRWPSWRGLIAMACLALAARLALHYELPLPGCPLREITDVPCPFCGSTRACAALAGFDFTGALRWNPLVTLSLMLGFGWLGFAVVQPKPARLLWLRGRGWLASVSSRRWLAGTLLLNWVYLCVRLPR